MGACGCGDNPPREIYQVGRGQFLGLAPYLGCSYCDTGIGYDLTFLDEKGLKDWADGVPTEKIDFDEFGGTNNGLMLGCIGADELRKAARALVETQEIDGTLEEYGTIDDWLSDFGLRLLQEAFRIHLKEVAENKEKRL